MQLYSPEQTCQENSTILQLQLKGLGRVSAVVWTGLARRGQRAPSVPRLLCAEKRARGSKGVRPCGTTARDRLGAFPSHSAAQSLPSPVGLGRGRWRSIGVLLPSHVEGVAPETPGNEPLSLTVRLQHPRPQGLSAARGALSCEPLARSGP